MVACQSQVSVLNKLLATKQRNVTPPPLPSPAVRSRTLGTSFESVNHSHTLTSQISNTSLHGPSSEISSSVDEVNYSSLNDSKTNDDNVSIASQRSTSSCTIN